MLSRLGLEGPDGRCFHVARAVIKSVQSFSLVKLQCQTKTKSADPEGYPLFPMLSQGLLTGKRPFQAVRVAKKSARVISTLLPKWFLSISKNELGECMT